MISVNLIHTYQIFTTCTFLLQRCQCNRRSQSHRPLWDAFRTWGSTASPSLSTGCPVRLVRSTSKNVQAERLHASSWKQTLGPRPPPTMCNLLPRQRMCLCVRMYILRGVCFNVNECVLVWESACKIEIWSAAYRFILFAARLSISVFILW